MSTRRTPQEAAQSLFVHLHPDANCLFLAGSFVRGEATDSSDLDLVVLYSRLPQAYRVSLNWEGYPVEAFVHDPQTLRYFFEKMDGPSGFPSLMQMVCEGFEVPGPTLLSAEMKQMALDVIEKGPPPLTEADLAARRYRITDLIDDIRTPRSPQELRATGTQLYEALADFYFRSQNLWSAQGKTVPRKLQQRSPDFAIHFETAFETLFVASEPGLVVSLAEDITQPYGGFLFEGYRLEAPANFRIDND